MEKIFKKWDRVYHFVYGWGNIVNDEFPLEVEFDSRKGPYRDIFKDAYLLSFTEYTLEGFSQERPEPLPQKGDIVWVSDDGISYWEISMYLDYDINEPDGPYIVSPNMIEGDHECWRYLTTKNPYENEQ